MRDGVRVFAKSGIAEVRGHVMAGHDGLWCDYEIRIEGCSAALDHVYVTERLSELRAQELARMVNAAYMAGLLGTRESVA